jgi:hypothetical protein
MICRFDQREKPCLKVVKISPRKALVEMTTQIQGETLLCNDKKIIPPRKFPGGYFLFSCRIFFRGRDPKGFFLPTDVMSAGIICKFSFWFAGKTLRV